MTPRRDTVQQRAIRQAIESAGRPLSVQEIFETAADEAPGSLHISLSVSICFSP